MWHIRSWSPEVTKRFKQPYYINPQYVISIKSESEPFTNEDGEKMYKQSYTIKMTDGSTIAGVDDFVEVDVKKFRD